MTIEAGLSPEGAALAQRSDDDVGAAGSDRHASANRPFRSFVSYLPAADGGDEPRSFSEQGVFVNTDHSGSTGKGDIFPGGTMDVAAIPIASRAIDIGPQSGAGNVASGKGAPIVKLDMAIGRDIAVSGHETVPAVTTARPARTIVPQTIVPANMQPGHILKAEVTDASIKAAARQASSDIPASRVLAAFLAEREARNAALPIRIAMQDMRNGMEIVARVAGADRSERERMRTAVARVLAGYGITDFEFRLNGEAPASAMRQV